MLLTLTWVILSVAEAVLSTVWYLAMSLASTHWMPGAAPQTVTTQCLSRHCHLSPEGHSQCQLRSTTLDCEMKDSLVRPSALSNEEFSRTVFPKFFFFFIVAPLRRNINSKEKNGLSLLGRP